MPLGIFSPRLAPNSARQWVVSGLRVPEQVVTHEKNNAHLNFDLGIDRFGGGIGGGWERWFVANPKAQMADTIIQLFNDAVVTWSPREHLWHIGTEYHEAYEWARNQDKFKFFLAFYQDPYPDLVRD
jgi:hypothetical protein